MKKIIVGIILVLMLSLTISTTVFAETVTSDNTIAVENANKISREISIGTRDYADAILERVEDVLRETLGVVHNNRKELK